MTHDQNKGTSPASTPPVSSQAGSLLLAISMGRSVNFQTPTDSFGNRFAVIGDKHPYANGPFYTAVFSSVGAKGGANHVLSAAVPEDPADEISLALVEILHGRAVHDVVYRYAPKGSPMTAGQVTTDGPATLIAIWGGDASVLEHTAVPGDGFQVIESYLKLGPTSGVQIAVATKQVTAAGAYSMTWAATPEQGAACYLIAVE